MTTPAAAAVASLFRPFPPIEGGGAPSATLVSLYALNGGAATDSESGVNGTVVGSWTATDGDSMVNGVVGTSLYKTGGAAYITLPAAQAAHDLSALSLVLYYQPTASGGKHIMFCASGLGGATAAGDFSIERLADGRLRAWHVGQDGGLRHFGSGTEQGIDGTDLNDLTAYRIAFTLGPSGAKLYLNDTLVGSIPQNTNGWNNARVKYIGIWADGVQAPMQGLIDHVRIWDGELSTSEIAALEDAVSVDIPGTPSVTDLPYFGQYYGCGYCGPGGAANTQMKASSDSGISFFFFAERAGQIDRLVLQRRTGTDYSAGDGGTYTVEIRTANAQTKLPIPLSQGGQIISQLTGYQPGNPAGSNSVYQTLTFTSTPGQTVAKQPYCLVFRNTHTSPNSNYFSTNISLQAGWSGSPGSGHSSPPSTYQEPSGVDPQNPGSSPAAVEGWLPIYIDGVEWHPWPAKAFNGNFQYNRLGPEHCSLRYTDGQWVFFGVFPAGSVSIGTAPLNGTSMQARERFRVSRANRTVSGVFLRVTRLNGTTGNLTVRLEQGPITDAHFPGNGTVLETVTVPHTQIYDVDSAEKVTEFQAGGFPFDIVHYIWVPFSQNRTLTIGTIYNLRLSVSSGFNCQMRCNGRVDHPSTGLGGIRGSSAATWDDWEAQRALPWTAWEDSRGFQVSSDGGTTWAYAGGWLSPIIFKCV